MTFTRLYPEPPPDTHSTQILVHRAKALTTNVEYRLLAWTRKSQICCYKPSYSVSAAFQRPIERHWRCTIRRGCRWVYNKADLGPHLRGGPLLPIPTLVNYSPTHFSGAAAIGNAPWTQSNSRPNQSVSHPGAVGECLVSSLAQRGEGGFVFAGLPHQRRTGGVSGSFALRDPSSFFALLPLQTVGLFLGRFNIFLVDDADFLWWYGVVCTKQYNRFLFLFSLCLIHLLLR